MTYSPPKSLDLNTTVLVLALFEGFDKHSSPKIEQSCRTVIGLLKGMREELLKKQVIEARR